MHNVPKFELNFGSACVAGVGGLPFYVGVVLSFAPGLLPVGCGDLQCRLRAPFAGAVALLRCRFLVDVFLAEW